MVVADPRKLEAVVRQNLDQRDHLRSQLHQGLLHCLVDEPGGALSEEACLEESLVVLLNLIERVDNQAEVENLLRARILPRLLVVAVLGHLVDDVANVRLAEVLHISGIQFVKLLMFGGLRLTEQVVHSLQVVSCSHFECCLEVVQVKDVSGGLCL